MRNTIALLAAAMTVPTPVYAADKPVDSLPFTGKWELNYDKNSCHLSAAFGAGERQVAIMFTRYQPGDDLEIILAGRQFSGSQPFVEVTTDFSSDGTFAKDGALRGNLGKMPMVMISSRQLLERPGFPPPITPQEEAAVRSLTVRVGHSSPFKLETGSMGNPMKAMRTCTASLVQSWGYDPVATAALARMPIPKSNPLNWVLPADYPADARFRGANGRVHFRLDVEADGSVSGCNILSEFKPAEFAEATCKAIRRRAAFLPALTRAGEPARGYYISSVTWIMNR